MEHNAQINDHFKFKTSCKSHKPEPLSFAVFDATLHKKKQSKTGKKEKTNKKILHRKIKNHTKLDLFSEFAVIFWA